LNGHHEYVFGSLSPTRRRLVLGVIAAGLAAILTLAVVAVLMLTALGEHNPVVMQSKAGPILLVPGYGGSTDSLQPLANRLRAMGKDVEIVSLPGNAEGDLREQAKVLATAAKATLKRTGATSVDVVGYSAGGVVARLWVRDYGGAALARRIVTLGSPQHGTLLAQLGSLLAGACPMACIQLGPTSDLLIALNTAPETPRGPAFISIWTSHDQVVLPPESAQLQGALNISVQSVCPNSTVRHDGLPNDPLVAAMVAAELQPAPLEELAAKDCQRLSS
jgi:triacylglycerol esterase/lipase EstA (alpha/beta hydrolase family)